MPALLGELGECQPGAYPYLLASLVEFFNDESLYVSKTTMISSCPVVISISLKLCPCELRPLDVQSLEPFPHTESIVWVDVEMH